MGYINQCVADGALSLWPLSEPVGSTTAIDVVNASGNGTYMNVIGIVLAQNAVPGIGATSCRFTSGNQSYMQAPAYAGNAIADTFTYECWAKYDGTSPSGLICSSSLTSNQRPYYRLLSNGINTLESDTASMGISRAAVPIDGFFHHVVWTKQGSQNHIFLDSIDFTPVPITNRTFASNNGATYFIGRNNSANEFSNSVYSCPAVYGTALSPDVVRNHFLLGSLALNQVTNGLAGWRSHT